MAVILNFLLKKNQFVSIDEVETSIHYELLSYFIRLFLANSEGTSQLLLTTHDINLLNEEFIRRDTIWFTDKDELGETKILRLSSLGLHKNLSPYNAYKQGKLVKLPFLGSQYFSLNEL
jgi:AAA15 family ATPase/GTPase